MQAYDSASPDQKIFTEVVFPVRRNENAPQFASQVFNADISENFPLGVSIIQVTATDNDEVRTSLTNTQTLLMCWSLLVLGDQTVLHE